MTVDIDQVRDELRRLQNEKHASERDARNQFKKELARSLRVPWRVANPKPVKVKTVIAKRRAAQRKQAQPRNYSNEELMLFTAQQMAVGERIIARLQAEGKLK